MSLVRLHQLLRDFNEKREWEQFHSPRNLLLALVGEVGELAAEVQWVPDAEIAGWLQEPQNKTSIEGELADVFAYLLQLADALGVDLERALEAKVAINEKRYPADEVSGSSAKYKGPDEAK